MTMDIATLGIRVDATEARLAAVELDRLGAAGGRTATSMSAVERATKLLAGAFVGLSAIELAKQIIGVNREFETLRTSLITTTGSIEKAGLAFKFIQDFAAKTPFDVQQVTESFIKLGNLGLKPSEAALRSYGNTAAAQAKPIMQMIEAVADAATGEFERLKEFGIKAKVHGDNVGFVFQGVTTEVKNNAQAIEGYLINLGNTKFGDAMANQSKTINGSISTLSDTWSTFMDNLLNDAKENMIAKWVQTAGNALHWLDIQMNGAIRTADKLAEVDARIAANKAALNAHDKNGALGSLVDGLAGYDPSLVKNRIDADIKLRAELTKTIDGEKKAQDALVATMGVSSTTQDKTTESKKAQEKAAKDAAKAEDTLAKSFADTLSGLSLHNIELSKTTREHKEAELSAKGYTQAMVAQAMALYDIGTALEAKKKLHEAEKSELDSLIDKYNQLTLSARDYKLTQLNAQGITGTEQAPIMAQFDKNAGAEATKKATDDATASLDAYNKKLDDANTKTSDLGAVTSAIFDGALGGITAMAGAFDAMVASIDANTKKLQENADAKKLNEATVDPVKKAANFEKYAKAEAKLNNDNVKASLTGASQMAGAAANLFDKKSSAAKAFHNIEIGLSVLRLAMDIKEIASSMTKTAVKTAEGASTMFAQSGWLGFAGVAAMLAVMAGLGFASGGSGGASEPPKSNDGTGTVLGDSSAKSESLAKTNDLLKNIHASEYVELRGINAGVNNLSKSILNTVTQLFQGGGLSGVSLTQTDALTGISKSLNTLMAIGTGGLSILVSKIPLIGGIFDKVNSFLFGGKQTQSVVGQGIETWGTNLGGVISGGNVAAGEYADIKTHTSGGLFGKSKDSYMTGYQAVGADMQKALNDVFKNVGTNLLVVAKSLGQGLTETVKKAIIPAMRVDLMGLTGEDAAKKLNNVIGATLDTMSSDIFGKVVGKYQQLGEGMFETASRIVMEVEIVKDAFAQSGKKLTGDVIGIADAFIQASGGLEEFQKRFEFFIDKFTTDAEKQTRATKTIKGSLKEEFTDAQIKKALSSRDNYASMVDFRAGKKGKENIAEYALLLEMAPKLDEYFSNKESLANDKTAMNIKLMDLQGNKSGALAKTRELELAAMDKTLRPMQQLIYAQTDLNNANTLAAALLAKRNTQEIQLMNLSGDTAGALAKTRALELAAMDESLWLKQNEIYAQTDLNTANEKAKTDLNAANEAAKALATSRANLEIKLMEAQGRTAEALAKTRELEIAAMDESLWKTQNLIYAFTDINTAMDKATGDVTTAMSRLTELSGKLKSTLSSTAIETSASLKADRANANALLKTALIIAKMGGAIDNITGMDKALADVAKPSEQLYTTFTDYARDQAITSNTISELSGYADKQVSMAQKQLDAINGTTTAIEKTLPEALAVLMGLDAQKKALPQFASGGYHSGGWRVVGENGPELEHTGASRIFSNGQSKGLLSTDELVAELQALRAEVRAGQEAIANNTRQTAKILRDVTQDGQSITTSAVVV